ncbi:hypothetical protein ACFQ21_21580 [Ohtaekwangia kribbensis]|uniref:XRE family transcriptional regulator n=1 Tax=Ohtaekwangia kribbensis TaxID=688913 RepID=A0ABW3K8L9_9BACT
MKKKEDYLDREKFDGLILTRNLSSKELDKAKDELAEARRRIQSGLSDRDRLAAKILQFKLKLKDYLKKDDFDPNMRFSSCLVQYVHILDIKRRAFAEEIDIDETELSQVINKHRPPAEYLFIRLEIHSNNNIPANWWYKLIEKEKEHHISTDKGLRNQQKKHVRKKLEVTV